MEYRVKVTDWLKRFRSCSPVLGIPNSAKMSLLSVGDEFYFAGMISGMTIGIWGQERWSEWKSDEVCCFRLALCIWTEGVPLLGGMGCNQQIYYAGHSGRAITPGGHDDKL